jgi:hypothetical protein
VAENEKGPPATLQSHSVRMNLSPCQPVQLVGMPLTKLGVLRCLADDWVLDDRIAEVIDHRSDGEHATH